MQLNSFFTPVGLITITELKEHLVSLRWGKTNKCSRTPLISETVRQLNAYFQGKLEVFDLPIQTQGTSFQKKVWVALDKIAYGQTLSYSQLASLTESGPRAIGGACRANPIPIIIPCHRVLKKNGKLGGYSGGNGINTKRFLIDLELRKKGLI
tara:strand:- start:361 stop:819 length:459 start_codon:yes stop_codon:yes gene_type:complete